MPELIIALLMIVNGEIKEHRIQESMSACLKGKRVAMRETKKSVNYPVSYTHLTLPTRTLV